MSTAARLTVLSPELFEVITASSRLARLVSPEGVGRNPYEILSYDATLRLDGASGAFATFERRQNVRFLQNGVGAVLDHVWGDGDLLRQYENTAGPLEDSFRDRGRHHLLLRL